MPGVTGTARGGAAAASASHTCAFANHEREQQHPSRRGEDAAPQDDGAFSGPPQYTAIHHRQAYPMSPSPPAPPSLQDLRKEIDAIDEQVHRLLMARGDTIESIWRVIISTFTYVQAPFAVHADISVGESMMRDSARFHFGFVVPYVSHFSAQAAVDAVAKSKGDLALVSATSGRTPWWNELEASGAPKSIARLPFLERADHPAALPVFVISRVADDAMVTEVEMWSIRVSGWNADTARALAPLADIVAVPDTAYDGAALLVSIAGGAHEKIKAALIEAGAAIRSSALVGSHATRYTVPPNGSAKGH